MNQDYSEPQEKKSLRRIIIAGVVILFIVVIAAAIGFFATMSAVRTANSQAVKDEIITQNSRLRQSAVDNVLSGDMVSRTKSTDTVVIELKVASNGTQYCIEAALREDPTAARYHMNEKTPELEPVGGLCGDNAMERPTNPTEFRLGSSGAGVASFSWNVIPDARSYTVTCKASGVSSITTKTRKVAATVEGLSAGVMYDCAVSAENSAGESGSSNAVIASSKAPLAVPKDLKLTSRTSSSLSYSWGSATEVKYYVFEYSTDDSFVKDVKKVTTTSPQTTLTGLQPGTGYFVHVKVVTNTVTEQQAPFGEVVQGRTEK